jgi:tRNA A37 methylthiotransferase MiaB
VDAVAPVRSHGHDHEDAAADPDPASPATVVTGRTRGNKLVHVPGDAALVGHEVHVRVDHAGPYALRASVVKAF